MTEGFNEYLGAIIFLNILDTTISLWSEFGGIKLFLINTNSVEY